MDNIESIPHYKLLLDANDLQRAGFSRVTTYRLLNREDMPVIRIGRRRFMNAELFRQWLNGQSVIR